MEREGTASANGIPGGPTRSGQHFWRQLALGVLAGVFAGSLLLLMHIGPGNGLASLPEEPPPHKQLFRDWNKPELVIIVSGQMDGYLQPCGCSHPQYGGLSRRWNFIQSLKKKGWTVAAIDLGDLAQKSGPQLLLKYEESMKALKLLDYSAVGVGWNEMKVPLWQALSTYALNHEQPKLLAANLLNREKGAIFYGIDRPMIQDWEVISKPGAPQVGVIGLVGKSLTDKINSPDPKFSKESINDPDLKFHEDNALVIGKALAELKAKKVDLAAVLYQGSLKEAEACANYCEKLHRDDPTLPLVQLVLCRSDQDEPPGTPNPARCKAKIITIGHKSRYVGAVGIFRDPVNQGFSLEYQLVSIGPEFETPEGQEKGHPLMDLMEDYARQVKDKNYLKEYRETPHAVQVSFPSATYVGSDRCLGCHPHAAHVWMQQHGGRGHSSAYQTLEKATRPGLRQYDGECVQCHVTGFGHNTGFVDAWSKEDRKRIERLKGVGCESCHGPGSEHVKNTGNLAIHAVMNPWKALPEKVKTLQMDLFCQKCHDVDNDVHWSFAKKWPKIAHPTPPEERKKQAAAAPLAAPPPVIEQPPPNANVPPPQQEKRNILDPLGLFKKFRRPSSP